MIYLSINMCKSLILLILFSFSSILAMDSNNCTLADFLSYGEIVENPKMRYYLFTRNNLNDEQEIDINNPTSLENSNYNNQWQTRIMMHGWKGNLTSCINGYVKDAYLQHGDFNVIIVDWYDWSRDTNYFKISELPFVNLFGQLLADFINILINYGTSYSDIYLIGHSMGAHLCGSAGRKLPNNNKVNTIFGLDPSGLYFNGMPDKILQCSDASYVEAIITSMGTWAYIGHIGCSTYYPNGGILQPYCILHEPSNPVCNHVAGVRYFSESINSNVGFCAAECPFLSPKRYDLRMGGEPSIPKYGIRNFCLTTNPGPSFAQGC